MKIALVYDALYPFTKAAAAKRYHELALRLAARHEVHFISWQHWPGTPRMQMDGFTYHGVGKPFKFYGEDGKRRISEALGFAGHLLKDFPRERFDVIDCSTLPFFP